MVQMPVLSWDSISASLRRFVLPAFSWTSVKNGCWSNWKAVWTWSSPSVMLLNISKVSKKFDWNTSIWRRHSPYPVTVKKKRKWLSETSSFIGVISVLNACMYMWVQQGTWRKHDLHMDILYSLPDCFLMQQLKCYFLIHPFFLPSPSCNVLLSALPLVVFRLQNVTAYIITVRLFASFVILFRSPDSVRCRLLEFRMRS